MDYHVPPLVERQLLLLAVTSHQLLNSPFSLEGVIEMLLHPYLCGMLPQSCLCKSSKREVMISIRRHLFYENLPPFNAPNSPTFFPSWLIFSFPWIFSSKILMPLFSICSFLFSFVILLCICYQFIQLLDLMCLAQFKSVTTLCASSVILGLSLAQYFFCMDKLYSKNHKTKQNRRDISRPSWRRQVNLCLQMNVGDDHGLE